IGAAARAASHRHIALTFDVLASLGADGDVVRPITRKVSDRTLPCLGADRDVVSGGRKCTIAYRDPAAAVGHCAGAQRRGVSATGLGLVTQGHGATAPGHALPSDCNSGSSTRLLAS